MDDKQALAGILRAEIEACKGREPFLRQIHMSAKTLTAIMKYLDDRGPKPWLSAGEEPRLSADGVEELAPWTAQRWDEILTKLGTRIHWDPADVFAAFDFPIRDRVERPKFHRTLDQLKVESEEQVKYAIVLQDKPAVEPYRALVTRIVKSIWPKWELKPRSPSPAGTLLALLESREDQKAVHLGVGFVRTPRRETGAVGFLPVPGIRWKLSFLAFEIKGKAARRASSEPIGWNDIFVLGNPFEIHVLERDAGEDHVLGQKARPCSPVPYKTGDSSDADAVAKRVAKAVIESALNIGRPLNAFVSDEGTVQLVRRHLVQFEQIKLLPTAVPFSNSRDTPSEEDLRLGFPPSYEISIAFKYDNKIRRLLHQSLDALYDHCYQDMAQIYAQLYAGHMSGIVLEPSALEGYPLFCAALKLISPEAREAFEAHEAKKRRRSTVKQEQGAVGKGARTTTKSSSPV